MLIINKEPTHKLGTDDHKYGHSYFKKINTPLILEVVFHEGRHQLTNAEDEFFFPSVSKIQEGLVHPDLLNLI